MENELLIEQLNTPVAGRYDLIVCGAGPAGIAAAITAGRRGLRVLLIEEAGCLGGMWTSGLLSLTQDAGFRQGLWEEIRARLEADGAYLLQPGDKSGAYDGSRDYTYDAEAMKALLEEMAAEAGVKLLLYSRVVAVATENGSITAVVTEGPGGRRAFEAALFADCTGNGDVGALAGNPFEQGHPQSGKLQPASLIGFISGFAPDAESTFNRATKGAFWQLFADGGVEPSYKGASLFRLPNPSIACIMINHEYGVDPANAESLTAATTRARAEVYGAVKALAKTPGWQRVRLVATAATLGIREGRRLQGRYTVNAGDMIAGRSFEDGICTVGYPVDIHALDGSENATHRGGVTSKPYQLPYRSLVSAGFDNLAFAGRCISGDFFAHASYRVTGNAVPMGEAVGVAAALAAAAGAGFTGVDGSLVKREMDGQSGR